MSDDLYLPPPNEAGWRLIVAALILAVLSLAMCGCCQTCPTYDRPVLVDASAVWRCGDHWCVTDGWMAVHDADDAECNKALTECLDLLQTCPE